MNTRARGGVVVVVVSMNTNGRSLSGWRESCNSRACWQLAAALGFLYYWMLCVTTTLRLLYNIDFFIYFLAFNRNSYYPHATKESATYIIQSYASRRIDPISLSLSPPVKNRSSLSAALNALTIPRRRRGYRYALMLAGRPVSRIFRAHMYIYTPSTSL